jgi:hypothetical protein
MLLVVAEVVVRMEVVIMKYSVLCYRLLLSLMALTHAVTSRYATIANTCTVMHLSVKGTQ